ncbi:MAG: hypothetical protein NVS9B14_06660 [Candidatus Acidiferrum sp.]
MFQVLNKLQLPGQPTAPIRPGVENPGGMAPMPGAMPQMPQPATGGIDFFGQQKKPMSGFLESLRMV